MKEKAIVDGSEDFKTNSQVVHAIFICGGEAKSANGSGTGQ